MGGALKGATCLRRGKCIRLAKVLPEATKILTQPKFVQFKFVNSCGMRIHTWPREQLDVLQDARETVSGINTYGRQTEAVQRISTTNHSKAELCKGRTNLLFLRRRH